VVRAFIVAVVGIDLLGSTGAGAVLRWKLTPGVQYRVFLERNVQQTSPLIHWTEELATESLWTVTAVDDAGTMQINQLLTHVKQSLRLPGTPPIEYDSAEQQELKGDVAHLASAWKSKLNVERRLQLQPNGEWIVPASPAAPVSATPTNAGPAPVATSPATTSAAPPQSPEPSGAGAGASANANPPTVTPSRTERLLQLRLPAGELRPGVQWTDTQAATVGGRTGAGEITVVYTYEGAELVGNQSLERIRLDTQTNWQPPDSLQGTLSLERQRSSGLIYFDSAAGFVNRAELSQELRIRMLPANETPVSAEVTTTMRVRIEPVPPATPEAPVVPDDK
jgi:hypothetical protein